MLCMVRRSEFSFQKALACSCTGVITQVWFLFLFAIVMMEVVLQILMYKIKRPTVFSTCYL